MEKPTTSNVMPKRDHERDLELDKKIQALRRKNEAVMKRYKEVEEDKKKAEEEGMALQSRKGKADDLTITINKSLDESRVVVTKPFRSGSPTGTGQQEGGANRVGDASTQGTGRGTRKQLTVTMATKKGKRVVSERPEKRPGPADVQSPSDEGQMRQVESAGRGKQTPKTTKRESSSSAAAAEKMSDMSARASPLVSEHNEQQTGDDEAVLNINSLRKEVSYEDPFAEQEESKPGPMNAEEHHKDTEQKQEPESLQASTDLNIPTSREEQEEYLQWKKEREQIDRERVARHKNAKGQWRRAWDMEKTENMFSDKSLPDRDWGASIRGGRNARRGQQKAGSKGHDKRGKDKAAKNVLVMSSKAKGRDRLTGRARRWQENDDGENPQTTDTTLEEFLEELDATTDANEGDLKDQNSKANPGPLSADSLKEDTVSQSKAVPSPPRGQEKKVRFSEELIQRPPAKKTTTSLHSASPDSNGSLKAFSPKQREAHPPQPDCVSAEEDDSGYQDKGGGLTAPPIAQRKASKTEHVQKDTSSPEVSSCALAEETTTCPHESPVQPVEVSKCNSNSTNTEELIDSTLSVLRIDSGESHTAHSTSNDKAREHGKVV